MIYDMIYGMICDMILQSDTIFICKYNYKTIWHLCDRASW